MTRKKQSPPIFDIATKLTPELIEEIIRLWEHRNDTSNALYKASNPPKSEFRTAINMGAWVRAQEAAANLPEMNLIEFLKTLPYEQMVQLLALVWLGRGDAYGPVRYCFAHLCKLAETTCCPEDVQYILQKPLKLYLRNALQLHPDYVLPNNEIEIERYL